jgi:hypothetical protein
MQASSSIRWLVLSAAMSAGSLAGRSIAATPAQNPQLARFTREFPDDPPGVAAAHAHGSGSASLAAVGPFASVQVNVDANGLNITGDAANEASIAVDPTDGNNIVIAWRQFDTTASNFRQAGWAYSRDGGRSWTFPGVLTPGTFRSDPVLAADASGNFYYNSLTIRGTYVADVFKSTDHGMTWGSGVAAYGGDKTWMTVDGTASVGAGHVYNYWSAFAGCCGNATFNRSTDGAQSFASPVVIPNTPVWGTLDVKSDGTLFLGGASTQTFANFYAARSSNARNAAVTPSFDLSTQVDLGGTLIFSNGTSPNPGGLCGQVWVATDRSNGPTAGNVYMLASVDPAGSDPCDVHFVRSVDNGVTWSAPVRVNDDPVSSNAWQWFGTLSVAPNGRIDVVWNDTRNTGLANMSQLYRSSSSDGGVTWTTNQALTSAWDSYVGWPNQNKIGDYYHMVSDAVGADLAFAATFNGEEDVYFMRIGDRDCNHNGVGDALDISSGASLDTNLDAIPDECESSFTPFCTCPAPLGPCGNNDAGAGCANSGGSGALMTPSGSTGVLADDLVLTATNIPPAKSSIGVWSAVIAAPAPFYDGRRCLFAPTRRLALKTSSAGGVVSYGPGLATSQGFSSGMSIGFQVWYRDPTGPCATTANISSAVRVAFTP